MRDKIIKEIKKEKIIVIVRGVYGEDCLNLASALYKGGIRLLEVTFDQNNKEDQLKTHDTIKLLNDRLSDKITVGAGTVTSVNLLRLAKKAGAKFIISPDCNHKVIKKTVKMGLVSIPGAMTPTEIKTAYDSGADFVKVFPVTSLGANYIKAVKAPLNNISLLAVGGVNADNISDFISAGADGVGVGGNLVNKDFITAGRFDEITALAKEYTKNLRR
jgi:2-dehydro-3-deoxyphosphogluconate aldolase/(4S)-4-hydroxy-2-oxoglutarate aldolase